MIQLIQSLSKHYRSGYYWLVFTGSILCIVLLLINWQKGKRLVNKTIVLLIAQTRIAGLDFEKKVGIGYQVLAELAYIPDSFIVDNSDEIIKMINEYINYSYQLPGYKRSPNWFRDEWLPAYQRIQKIARC